jgi:hypothetical protein
MNSNIDTYLLPGFILEWGEDIIHNFRAGPGITIGSIVNFNEKFKIHPSAGHYYLDEWSKFRKRIIDLGIETSYNFSQSVSVRASFHEIHSISLKKNNNEFNLMTSYMF